MGRITKMEQETTILFNEQEQHAEVFTYNKALQKRLSGLCEKHPEEFTCKGNNGAGAKTFICPKKRITITAPRKLSPEQRERQRERAKQNLK